MVYCMAFRFFFFKQKTAYEMRISDWSSDVCSSDLNWQQLAADPGAALSAYTARLAALRRAHCSLRTARYGDAGHEVAPGLAALSWFTEAGQPMDEPAWEDAGRRTLAMRRADTDDGQDRKSTRLNSSH